MVPDSTTATEAAPSDRPSSADGSSSTLVNVIVGGLVGIVLGFIPFSPVLGGAITGYLEDGPPGDGAKAGAMAGLVMFVPFFLLGLTVIAILLGVGGPSVAIGLVGLFVLVVAGVYTVGLGAVGGYLGTYLRDEL